MPDVFRLIWTHCLDGYRTVEATPEEIEKWEAAPLLAQSSLGWRMTPNVKFVPASDRIAEYEVTSEKCEALALQLTNTPTDKEHIRRFYSQHGSLRNRVTPTSFEELQDWVGAKDGLRWIFDHAARGDHQAVVQKFEEYELGVCRVSLRESPAGGPPLFNLAPESLWHFLLIQAARTINGGAGIRNCSVCSNYMLIGGTGGGYANKVTCSPKCRVALSRRRKRDCSEQRTA